MTRQEDIDEIFSKLTDIYLELLKIGIKKDNKKDEKQFVFMLLKLKQIMSIIIEKMYGMRIQ